MTFNLSRLLVIQTGKTERMKRKCISGFSACFTHSFTHTHGERERAREQRNATKTHKYMLYYMIVTLVDMVMAHLWTPLSNIAPHTTQGYPFAGM